MCLIQILRLYFGLTQGERHKAHDGFCSFGLGQVGFWDWFRGVDGLGGFRYNEFGWIGGIYCSVW